VKDTAVKSIEETPTRPVDYATLTAAYGSLLAALLLAARRRGQVDEGPGDLAATGAAAFALSKLVAHEKVETWLRAPFVEEREGSRHPRGEGLRYAVGELITCTRCAGAWSAMALVGLRTLAPRSGRVVTNVLAVSAINDHLQAGFRLLCERADQAPG
jgi:hypothetical protein